MFQDLKGKTVVVTGSGREKGIGKAVLIAFAKAGCNVVVSDIGTQKGDQFNSDHVGLSDEMESIVSEAKNLGVDAFAFHAMSESSRRCNR